MTASPTPDDLLARYRETHDAAALGQLFDATAPALFRVARSLVGDAALAEDVLQETFLAVIESADRFDPSRAVEPWLMGILKRQAANARRRRARKPDPARVPTPGGVDAPDEIASAREDSGRLSKALDELPEPYRGVALMRWRHGLQPAEIADIRGQAPGTIWSLLSRAKDRLKRALVTVPAVLAAFGAERGLGGVREAVLRRAEASATGPVQVGTGLAIVAGGGILANKGVVGAALALICVGLGGALWGGWFSSPTARPPADVVEQARAGRLEQRGTPRDAAASAGEDESSDRAAPEPVDLAAADRDRDLFGVTVDEAGNPVPGARLATVRRPWSDWSSMVPGAFGETERGPEAVSAADGTFSLRLSAGAAVHLRVTCDGYAPQLLGGCTAGERLRVRLVRGVPVTVTVNEADGTPAAGARVRVWGEVEWSGGQSVDVSAVAGADGRVRFPALAVGAGALMLEARRVDGVVAPIQLLELPESGSLARTVVLPVGRVLTGVVLDAETRAPIQGARVGKGWVQQQFVTTDASGRYRIPWWTGGMDQDLTVYADGYVWRSVEDPQDDVVDFHLSPGDWAKGRIVDADGVPISGARVIAQGSVRSGEDRARDAQSTISGEDGSFALTGIAREYAHTLVVCASGSGRTLVDFAPAEPPGEIAFGDVVLPRGRSISGLVHDPADAPVAGAIVQLSGGNGDRARLLGEDEASGVAVVTVLRHADDLGRFRFPDLAPGTYEVSLGQIDSRTVVLTEEDVTGVVLRTATVIEASEPERPTGSLRFVVRDASGRPVEAAEILVYDSGKRRVVVTDSAGTVTFDGLSVSALKYTVASPHGQREFFESRGGPVTPDGQEVVVIMEARALVRGAIWDPDGKPLARHALRATNTRTGKVRYARTDERGAFEIEVVKGQTYDVALQGDRQFEGKNGLVLFGKSPFRAEVAGVTAPADGVELRAHLPATTRELTVQVLDPDGAPVAGLQVRVPGVLPEQTNEDGKARFVGLSQTEVQVAVVIPPDSALAAEMILPMPRRVVPDGGVLTLSCRRGVILSGQVLAPDGSPRAGAMVAAFAKDRSFHTAPVTTDDEGRFRLVVRPDETHSVVAQWASPDDELFVAIIESVGPTDGDVELRLRAAPDEDPKPPR